MNAKEFSDGFDVYMNSYSQSVGDPLILGGLNFDEYEKSVFLTQAQEQLVKHLYKGSYGYTGFEETEELRRQLDALVKQEDYGPGNAINDEQTAKPIKDSKTHTIFKLPDECWYIIYESAINGEEGSCFYDQSCDIYPVSHDIYNRTIRNPFRGPNNNRVLRLDRGENYVELVSSFPIGKYIVRYIERPTPIILIDLEGTGLTINGETTSDATYPCTLNSVVHQNILELAVKLAYASRATTATTKSNSSDE